MSLLLAREVNTRLCGDLVADAKKIQARSIMDLLVMAVQAIWLWNIFAQRRELISYTCLTKAPGPMLTDSIGGQIQATFNGLPSLMGQIKGNALRPLAVGSLDRSKVLPSVPTIAESWL
jgi:hypothetical protein